MGIISSCCPKRGPASVSPFTREEVITVPDIKKSSVFASAEAPRDGVPLLQQSGDKMVAITDSDSDDFDPAMIEKLMKENPDSDERP
jgi:hypothetical protein